MNESNKRRRTSPDTYVEVGDQENDPTHDNKPVTPKRISYQSPTKASLARSNPTALQLLDQAKQKRESEPNRRQSLKDAVLGNRNNQRTPVQQSQALENDAAISQRRANVTSWIEDSFKDIPPLDPAPLIPTPKRSYHPPIPSSAIVPRLVKNHTADSTEQARRSTSVELPPTPVQLGKEVAPERPRGLLTSSPGGSGRRRVRVRHGDVQSSPLKPRELPPDHIEEDEDHVEIASGIGDDVQDLPGNSGGSEYETVDDVFNDTANHTEALEEVEPDTYVNEFEESDDPKVLDKLHKFKAFQQQLQALRAECSKLEALSNSFSGNDVSQDPVQKLQAAELLLSSYNDPPDTLVPRPEDQDIFKQNAEKYLTTFAPHALRISYETWEQTTKGSQKFVYQTTFAAPACWPSTTMLATFDIAIDMDSENVETVKYIPDQSVPRPLAKWITKKTDNALTRTDVGTIAAGISAYFHEATRKAKVFRYLDGARNGEEVSKANLDLDMLVTDSAEASSLCHYIAENSFIHQIGDGQNTRTRRSLGSAKQIMLIYDISLDWIGTASAMVDIAGSGFTSSTMDSAKKLFREKVDVDGIISAFRAVKSILDSDGGSNKGRAATTTKSKGKAARRMTEAEFT